MPKIIIFVCISLILLSYLFSGCYGIFAPITPASKFLVLELGDSKKMVLSELGEPKRTEKYAIDGKDYDIWIYQTKRNYQDGREPDDLFTPVVFENGKLSGWGRNYYDTTIKIKIMHEVK